MANQVVQQESVSARLTGRWEEVCRKISVLAEEFPAGAFDYRPVDGARTFADVLRHVAFWNRYVADTVDGRKADDSANDLPADEFATKAQVMAALQASAADAARALRERDLDPETAAMLVTFLEHTSEHYGQLAVYRRLHRSGSPNAFGRLLAAAGRSPEIPESADVYGWLVGSWELDVLHYRAADISTRNLKGEAHFGWVLEGRAIQDVWIMPRVAARTPDDDRNNNMYGTTLRVWDAAIQAWRIRWINPVRGHEERQTGRKVGNDIVQIGARADGTPTRWRFTEITPDSFHWIGEALESDGITWKIEGEFRARRM